MSFETAGAAGPMGWSPTGEDMTWFRDLLVHSDVVVNVASTTTIDAAALDRPVVNVAFDGGSGPVDPLRSVARFYSFHHYRRIVGSGGVRIAESPADLARVVAGYLADPARDAEGRRRIVAENCHRIDGGSARRIVDAVTGWLGTEAARRERG